MNKWQDIDINDSSLKTEFIIINQFNFPMKI